MSNDQVRSQQTSHPNSIGHYILGRTIGEGTFGKVKLGTHILTGEKVGVKILEKDRIKDVADVERVAREIHILKLIRHPNIIQLYEIIETPRQLFFIMEYAWGGELFDHIVQNVRLNEKEACKYFQEIISGVEYIHKLNIVHRDLKPENLLLDKHKNIKIVDFGLSNTYKVNELLKTACGSPWYAAPEMVAGKRYVGLGVDIWSWGIILFAVICGFLPFEDPNTNNLYKKILSGEFKIPRYVSENARDLLRKILNTNPNTRYTMEQIKAHPWYQTVPPRNFTGIMIGYTQIPVELDVLRQLENFGFDPEVALKCLKSNKHNHLTTTYYLLLKKQGLLVKSDAKESKNQASKPRPPSPPPQERALGPLKKILEQAATVRKPMPNVIKTPRATSHTPDPKSQTMRFEQNLVLPSHQQVEISQRAVTPQARVNIYRVAPPVESPRPDPRIQREQPRPKRGNEMQRRRIEMERRIAETERRGVETERRGVETERRGTDKERPRSSRTPSSNTHVNKNPKSPSSPVRSVSPSSHTHVNPKSPSSTARSISPSVMNKSADVERIKDIYKSLIQRRMRTRSKQLSQTQKIPLRESMQAPVRSQSPPLSRDIVSKIRESVRSHTPQPTNKKPPTQPLKVNKGPIGLAQMSTKSAIELIYEAKSSLIKNNINYKDSGSHLLRCYKDKVYFEWEIFEVENLPNILTIKFKRLRGNIWSYKDLISKVFAFIKL